MVAVAVLSVVIAVWRLLLWFGEREMLRHEAAYNAEMRQLNLDYEVRIRGEINRLLRGQRGGPNGREFADRVFEMLRLSRVANNSREVMSWEGAPHSPERL